MAGTATINERETWSVKFDFILALMGFSIRMETYGGFPTCVLKMAEVSFGCLFISHVITGKHCSTSNFNLIKTNSA